MAEALREVIASGADPFAESRAMLGDALAALLGAAAATAEGAIRDDVRADEVLMSLSGIALAAGQPAQREQAGACSTCSWMACASPGERALRLRGGGGRFRLYRGLATAPADGPSVHTDRKRCWPERACDGA